jgi:uncharacterized protein YbbC (DUF1343 family)
VPTSPHIPEPDSPLFYPATGILGELGVVNIGVGYTLPFKIAGAPWMDAEKITAAMNAKKLPGVLFQPFYFKPFYGLFKDRQCGGFRIIVADRKRYMPASTGYHIMEALLKEYPEKFDFKNISQTHRDMFDKVNGTDIIRIQLLNGISAKEIINGYRPALEEFIEKRTKYLLYQ